MTDGTAVGPPSCRWCGLSHGAVCRLVKAMEFYPDGTVRRVEFKTGLDYPPIALGGQHAWPARYSAASALPPHPESDETR